MSWETYWCLTWNSKYFSKTAAKQLRFRRPHFFTISSQLSGIFAISSWTVTSNPKHLAIEECLRRGGLGDKSFDLKWWQSIQSILYYVPFWCIRIYAIGIICGRRFWSASLGAWDQATLRVRIRFGNYMLSTLIMSKEVVCCTLFIQWLLPLN